MTIVPDQSNADGERRLWIASELMYPELTSTGFYVSAIAEHLAARQRQVHVVCAQPTYAARGTRAPAVERWRGVVIRRAPGTTLNKNTLPGRLANLLTFSASSVFLLLGHLRRGDVVLVLTNPPTLPLVVALACWWRRGRFVVLIHDLYPDTLLAVTRATESSWVVRAWRRMNQALLFRAAHVIVVGRDMQERVTRHYPRVAGKISVIPNWGEVAAIHPEPRAGNRMLSEHGLSGHFVVLYAGNLGRPNDLATIVEAAARLRDDPRFRFVFVGAGVKHRWLAGTIAARQLSNVLVLGPKPREQQQDFLNGCDVGVVPFVAGMWGVAVPSRLYNFMAAGKPVIGIAERGSEIDLVIRETGAGWVTAPHDGDGLLSALLDAAANPAELRSMGLRARRAAEACYDGRQALSAYASTLEALLDGATST